MGGWERAGPGLKVISMIPYGFLLQTQPSTFSTVPAISMECDNYVKHVLRSSFHASEYKFKLFHARIDASPIHRSTALTNVSIHCCHTCHTINSLRQLQL